MSTKKDVHVDKPPFSANSLDIFAGFLNCKMGRGQFIREQSNVKHKNETNVLCKNFKHNCEKSK